MSCARLHCRCGPGYQRNPESRIHGYCSHLCEAMDALELNLQRLERAIRRDAMLQGIGLKRIREIWWMAERTWNELDRLREYVGMET